MEIFLGLFYFSAKMKYLIHLKEKRMFELVYLLKCRLDFTETIGGLSPTFTLHTFPGPTLPPLQSTGKYFPNINKYF